jgi:hypothetical protein
LEQLIPILQKVIDYINNSQKTTVIHDGKSNRFLLGYQENGWGTGKSFGMKISKEGVNVLEANDDELLFSNDLSSWSWYGPDETELRIGLAEDSTYGMSTYQNGEQQFNLDMKSWKWFESNLPRMLLGKAPTDGRVGAWISEVNVNVLDKI